MRLDVLVSEYLCHCSVVHVVSPLDSRHAHKFLVTHKLVGLTLVIPAQFGYGLVVLVPIVAHTVPYGLSLIHI